MTPTPSGAARLTPGRALLAIVAGAALPLAFAPFGAFPVASVAVAVLMGLCEGRTPRAAALAGFLFGCAAFLAGIYWIYISVHVFGKAPLAVAIVLMVALVMFMACYIALTCYLITRFCGQWGALRWLVGWPAAWVLAEWARGWVLSGFPWLALGYSHSDTPLAGLAPIAGVFAMSAAVVMTAGALLALARGTVGARVCASGILLLLWAGGAALRTVNWTTPVGGPLQVSLVQGAVPQDRKWLPEQLGPTMQLYADLTRPHWGDDLVIWPEAAIPALALRLQNYYAALNLEATREGTALLIGTVDYDEEREQYLNSVMALGAERGKYHKRHLVPFGEFFPVPDFVREWMRLKSLPYRDYSAGPENPAPLRVGDVEVGVSICYEDVFGAELLWALPRAGLLVNVSNDAWFGGSIAPHQHLQIARLRALETGRYLLRATNTGISAIIGPDGAVEGRSPQFEPHVLAASVQPYGGSTPYIRWANWPIVLAASLALAAAGVARRLPRGRTG